MTTPGTTGCSAARFHLQDAEMAYTTGRCMCHARGLQCVRFRTRRGHVVVASDVAHHDRHLRERRVFPVADSVAAVLEGYDHVERPATLPDHVTPGHDPLVAEHYPQARPGLSVPIVRLDADPPRPAPRG